MCYYLGRLFISIIEYVRSKLRSCWFKQRFIHSRQWVLRLIPFHLCLIPLSYISSEQRCLRSVSPAVWYGIRPEFSIYPLPPPPFLLHPLHPSPHNLRSHFMMTGNPAGLEGRHLSSHSQVGIFWVIYGDYDLNAPQRDCDPSLASLFPSQIKTMTVKSANHQMYDSPQAHYCSAHGRRQDS